MKKVIFVLIILLTTGMFAQSQIKVDVEKKVNNEANNRANRKTDQAIDKAFDKLEQGIGSLFKKKKKKKKKKAPQQQTQQQNTNTQQNSNNSKNQQSQKATNQTKKEEQKPAAPKVKWNKYDFVPGDQVIFEDKPSADEENGEFPSRWDLYSGNAEIGEVNGETVIMFLGGAQIFPYIKNSKEDYLPDVFTMEFDIYFEPGEHYQRYWIVFRDVKNQYNIGISDRLETYVNGISFKSSENVYPGTERLNWGVNPVGGWRHLAIAYTKGKFKAYLDDTRLINIPHLEGNPTGLTVLADNKKNMYMKNIRIAKGGVKYYDRVLSDGKIIVNGIRFDVNKATIKPESNGAINKIFKLMQKQPDLNFSVEGHTDSDGDEATNLELSKARGKAVMNQLISLGIAANRLKYNGFGESKPITDNGTAEGKANNRRVEFVKF